MVSLVVAAAVNSSLANAETSKHKVSESMSIIRTYMDFSEKIDPAAIVSMTDLELSLSLASTLVKFSSERELVSALAEKWEIISPHQIKFTLRPGLKWSDGSTITTVQYKAALLRAKRLYANDLKALFDSIEGIEAPDSSSLVFTTINEVAKSGIVLKLTEPMYGLVRVNDAGALDLSKSTGPYFLARQSKTEITLEANPFWPQFTKDMPAHIEIRHSGEGVGTVEEFATDTWANLITDTSLIPAKTAENFKTLGYHTWQRSLDKTVSIFLSPRFVKKSGGELIKAIAQKMDKAAFVTGLSGLEIADQFFPRGYELWSQIQPEKAKPNPFAFAEPIEIIIPPLRSAVPIQKALPPLVKELSGKDPKFEVLPYAAIDDKMARGDFDMLIIGLAVTSPNFEGSMSLFFERTPPFFPSAAAPNDFSSQIKNARELPTTEERAAKMRETVRRAQEAGFVLPLFHFSSVGVAKPGIDLSNVPLSDESITFSKVRFR